MIAIIDYDAGNIKSVEKAVQFLGEEAIITRDRDVIMDSSGVILPGVGSFGDAMGKINEYGLKNVIYDVVDSGKPFLGRGPSSQRLKLFSTNGSIRASSSHFSRLFNCSASSARTSPRVLISGKKLA